MGQCLEYFHLLCKLLSHLTGELTFRNLSFLSLVLTCTDNLCIRVWFCFCSLSSHKCVHTASLTHLFTSFCLHSGGTAGTWSGCCLNAWHGAGLVGRRWSRRECRLVKANVLCWTAAVKLCHGLLACFCYQGEGSVSFVPVLHRKFGEIFLIEVFFALCLSTLSLSLSPCRSPSLSLSPSLLFSSVFPVGDKNVSTLLTGHLNLTRALFTCAGTDKIQKGTITTTTTVPLSVIWSSSIKRFVCFLIVSSL